MINKKEFESLSSRVHSSFQQLAAAASTLNSASDQLSKVVAEVDAALKPLNVGLVCWVDIHEPATRADGRVTYYEQIGYAKVNGSWGIAIRTMEEYDQSPGDSPDPEEWAFNDAPRKLRLKAIDAIPRLLEKLAKDAEKFTKSVTEKAAEAQQLLSAVKGGLGK